jgi:hypothetical protein
MPYMRRLGEDWDGYVEAFRNYMRAEDVRP